VAVALSQTSTGSAQVPNGTATVTISSLAIGAAAFDRLVFMGLGFFDITGDIQADPSSVTIGGVTATQAVVSNENAAWRPAVYEYWAALPSGTTANVVVDFPANAGTGNYIGVSLYSVTGADTTTPVSATASTDTQSTTQAVSGSIAVPSGGALIAMGAGLDSGNATGFSWANATQDTAFDGVLTSDGYSSASSTSATTSTRTVNNSNGGVFMMEVAAVAIQQAAAADVLQSQIWL
jgi:hypothetical protein